MHKVLISHEIPKALFGMNGIINDYPYVLAHLLWEGTEHYDPEYANFYKQVLGGFGEKYSILDNSCFELGASIPSDVLLNIYNTYRPSHLVLPDVMGNADETVRLTKEFLESVSDKRVKYLAVVQGKTVEDYTRCWDYYNNVGQIDVIGVNYRDLEDGTRFSFLCKMYEEMKIQKKIHLLGCNNPIEFQHYLMVGFRESIISVDTSSPIIHGWNLNWYDKGTGIANKPKELLADNLNRVITTEESLCIMHNVNLFQTFVNGTRY